MQAWALLTKSKWIKWLKHKVTKDVAIRNYNLRFQIYSYQEKKEFSLRESIRNLYFLYILRGGEVGHLVSLMSWRTQVQVLPPHPRISYPIIIPFYIKTHNPRSYSFIAGRLCVSIGSNIFWKCIRNKKTFQHCLFTSKPFGLFFLDVVITYCFYSM